MNDYIAKPVDERLLYNKINKSIRKSSTKNLMKSKQIYKNKKISTRVLNTLTKSNPKLMMEMIAAYLQTPQII
jgi:3-methyladenine DNA glycosylase AlkC